MHDPFIGVLLERYGDLLADCERYRDLGWYPIGGEVYKFNYVPTADAVDRFADYLFGGIGFEAPDFWVPLDAFGIDVYGRRRPDISDTEFTRYEGMVSGAAARFCQAVADAYPHRFSDYLALISEPHDFGGLRAELTINQTKVLTSRHAVQVGRRGIDICERLGTEGPTVKTLVEIGGGHGRTTRDLIHLLDVDTAFYVDLPLNMILAARFLQHFFGDRVNVVWNEEDRIVTGGINIVAPWLTRRIPGSVDLLVNFLSFQHMSMPALRYYGETLIDSKVRFLFHENREQPVRRNEVGIADYPFRRHFERTHWRETFRPTGPDGRVVGSMQQELLVRR